MAVRSALVLLALGMLLVLSFHRRGPDGRQGTPVDVMAPSRRPVSPSAAAPVVLVDPGPIAESRVDVAEDSEEPQPALAVRSPIPFEDKYAGASGAEIQLAHLAASQELGRLHHDAMRRAIELGHGESVSSDELSFGAELPNGALGGCLYSEERDSWVKVILTRETAPEAIAKRDEVLYLMDRFDSSLQAGR